MIVSLLVTPRLACLDTIGRSCFGELNLTLQQAGVLLTWVLARS